MPGGYIGKILFVDLTKGEINVEVPDDKLYQDFLGGYGIGARILYSRQKPGIDPLGPDNILGFITGPLTGTPALFGSRYTVVCKSPLTGGWGDANSGGEFGPYLKFAGFDSVFISGASEKPVYILIDEGKVEIKDADHLWGKDSNVVDDILKEEYGQKCRIACIGQSGEKLSLISCIMNDKGRAAGRSGVGAVMGSKKLKAIVARGGLEVPLADKKKTADVRQEYLKRVSNGILENTMRKYGTAGILAGSVMSGDAPIKNWGGVGSIDFPNADAISGDNVIQFEKKKYGCWRCPLTCGGHMAAGTEYDYEEGVHKPEYETLASFGAMCLNDNLESIVKCNDICNRYGLDTISAGAAIAFAIECYENGLITKEDTDGIEMTWGNHRSIVRMTELLAERKGFGGILADGVKVAAEKIGKGADQFAIHIGGQEIGMHDPKLRPGWTTAYVGDATPGRHTQGGTQSIEGFGAPTPGLEVPPVEKFVYSGKGESQRILSNMRHVVNLLGICSFGFGRVDASFTTDSLNAATGWNYSVNDLLTIGERVASLRHAYNLREGYNPLNLTIPPRFAGSPAPTAGPNAGVQIDVETQLKDYFRAMKWDPETAQPSREKLMELGLDDVAEDLDSRA